MNPEQEYKQNAQCNCPVCAGKCPLCASEGCGMCPYCKNTRCPMCPMCANQYEQFIGQETITEAASRLTFDRVLLILILVLVAYIAWSHYRE